MPHKVFFYMRETYQWLTLCRIGILMNFVVPTDKKVVVYGSVDYEEIKLQ